MAVNQTPLRCSVVTPERAVLDQEAEYIAIPLYDGELGVLPGRAPLVSRLGFGCLRLKTTMGENLLFLEGGTVQVAANVVTILTPRALELSALDTKSAEKVLRADLAGKNTPADSRARKKARAILRAALKAPRR
ncbi:MAG: ATP synthase F1 subunit epsilon [Gemmataceae bacterium]|nr:ATP synthase F1 subunit epsilon [Gemmataceae bacterium]